MNGKIVYLVSEDWYFYSHRFKLAEAAKNEGYTVIVITTVKEYGAIISDAGFKLIPVKFERSFKNPFKDIILLFKLINIYLKERPVLVHHISLKPALLGSIAAHVARIPVIINAVTGLGYLFSSKEGKIKFIRKTIKPALIFLFQRKNTWTIFQNASDMEYFFGKNSVYIERIILIKGSGVDLSTYSNSTNPVDVPIVMLASRMLEDKGVVDFVEAAVLLKKQGINARFVLVGDIDKGNPMSLEQDVLKKWQERGLVEWWGFRKNMAYTLGEASIVCLPSYHEGLPKVLLEAAAASKPLVATDIPGCREIVVNNETGLLVPVKNPGELANAIKILINNESLCRTMGSKARKLVEEKFSLDIVIQQTLGLYQEALNSHFCYKNVPES